MPKLLNGIKGDSNPGSLDCESGILPLSYRIWFILVDTFINHAMEFTNCVSAFAGRRHDTSKATTRYFSIANFSKNINANKCQYPDVSIGDRSDFNLNFSSELCKRVCTSVRVFHCRKCLDALGSKGLMPFVFAYHYTRVLP